MTTTKTKARFIPMQLQLIPRITVRTALNATRLPLTAAEAIFGKSEDQEWPPAIAWEKFEGSVKQVAGTVLRDDELVEEGKLIHAKAAQLAQAADLEAMAEQHRVEAESTFQARRQADEQRRRAIEDEAKHKQQQLEQAKAEKKRAAEAEARQAKAAARKAEQAAEKAVARDERRAKTVALEAERDAVAAERKAVKAESTLLDVEETLESTRQARKSAS